MVKSIAAASLLAVAAAKDHWAVIVAGSNGYWNYRHQADACHAYRIMREKAIPPENIILMSYDDVANDSQNPYPGKLFNKPTAAGVEGDDVYFGCAIDYRGADVTPENFMKVLKGTAKGKSLKSTSEDHVFINFVDHGAPGLIGFPHDTLHKQELLDTFQFMSDNNMFHKLVFYLEACESGSMFEGMNIPNVYALSAANPTESSWGAYCGSQASVNGKNIDSCLGDLFSINWMEDSDLDGTKDRDLVFESLDEQFQTVRTQTTRSQVMQWGDTSFTDHRSQEFIGVLDLPDSSLGKSRDVMSALDNKNPVNVRQVDLERLYSMYAAATTSAERLRIGELLQQELAMQMKVDLIHNRFLSLVFPGDEGKQEDMRNFMAKPDNMECELAVHRAFLVHGSPHFDANSGFALQFHQIVVNVCAEFAIANGPTSQLTDAVQEACGNPVVV